MTTKTTLHYVSAVLAAALVGAALATTLVTPAAANHLPANKMAVSGASIDVGAPGETLDILTGVIKSGGPSDLVISLSLECSILTQVQTVGNDVSEARATIVAWIEIDGVPVGVNAGDNGEVVFCDRVHQQETSLFDDDDATIRSYLATRTANSFNWIAMNLGSGTHTVVAKARLTAETDDDLALADAVVGKRTLVVEPTKLANDVVV